MKTYLIYGSIEDSDNTLFEVEAKDSKGALKQGKEYLQDTYNDGGQATVYIELVIEGRFDVADVTHSNQPLIITPNR